MSNQNNDSGIGDGRFILFSRNGRNGRNANFMLQSFNVIFSCSSLLRNCYTAIDVS